MEEEDQSEEVILGPAVQQLSPETQAPQMMLRLVSPSDRRKQDGSIPDLLAVLAPLAAIPLLGSLAVSSFTTMLAITGMGRRRRRRDTYHQSVLSHLSLPTNHSLTLLDTLNLANLTNVPYLSQLYPNTTTTTNSTNSVDSHNFAQDLPIFQGDSQNQTAVSKGHSHTHL